MTDVIETSIGRCYCPVTEEEQSKLKCFACGEEAKPWPWSGGPEGMGHSIVRVTCHCGRCSKPLDYPLCERCCANSDDVNHVIVRIVLNAPDLEIKKGGSYSSIETLKRDIASVPPEGSSKH